MKKEYSLILKGCLVNKSSENENEINTLLEEYLSWKEIAGILFNHRLGGYFYCGLTEAQRKKLPTEIREVLKAVVKVQKENQQELICEIRSINEELTKSKIHFAALKGAFFSSEMYELGARRSNDIDLLVYEKDLDILDGALRKMGYIENINTKQQKESIDKKKEKLEVIKQTLKECTDFQQKSIDSRLVEQLVERVVPSDKATVFKFYINLLGEENSNFSTDDYYLYTTLKLGFDEARAYRKSMGKYLRSNQWKDLTVEVYLKI